PSRRFRGFIRPSGCHTRWDRRGFSCPPWLRSRRSGKLCRLILHGCFVPSNSIHVENITVRYHVGGTEQVALDDVSLVLAPGEFTLIMGPSGSGKTTLLSILGCLLTPDAGRVTMLGQNVGNFRDAAKTEFRRNHVAFVFQAFRLLS